MYLADALKEDDDFVAAEKKKGGNGNGKKQQEQDKGIPVQPPLTPKSASQLILAFEIQKELEIKYLRTLHESEIFQIQKEAESKIRTLQNQILTLDDASIELVELVDELQDQLTYHKDQEDILKDKLIVMSRNIHQIFNRKNDIEMNQKARISDLFLEKKNLAKKLQEYEEAIIKFNEKGDMDSTENGRNVPVACMECNKKVQYNKMRRTLERNIHRHRELAYQKMIIDLEKRLLHLEGIEDADDHSEDDRITDNLSRNECNKDNNDSGQQCHDARSSSNDQDDGYDDRKPSPRRMTQALSGVSGDDDRVTQLNIPRKQLKVTATATPTAVSIPAVKEEDEDIRKVPEEEVKVEARDDNQERSTSVGECRIDIMRSEKSDSRQCYDASNELTNKMAENADEVDPQVIENTSSEEFFDTTQDGENLPSPPQTATSSDEFDEHHHHDTEDNEEDKKCNVDSQISTSEDAKHDVDEIQSSDDNLTLEKRASEAKSAASTQLSNPSVLDAESHHWPCSKDDDDELCPSSMENDADKIVQHVESNLDKKGSPEFLVVATLCDDSCSIASTEEVEVIRIVPDNISEDNESNMVNEVSSDIEVRSSCEDDVTIVASNRSDRVRFDTSFRDEAYIRSVPDIDADVSIQVIQFDETESLKSVEDVVHVDKHEDDIADTGSAEPATTSEAGDDIGRPAPTCCGTENDVGTFEEQEADTNEASSNVPEVPGAAKENCSDASAFDELGKPDSGISVATDNINLSASEEQLYQVDENEEDAPNNAVALEVDVMSPPDNSNVIHCQSEEVIRTDEVYDAADSTGAGVPQFENLGRSVSNTLVDFEEKRQSDSLEESEDVGRVDGQIVADVNGVVKTDSLGEVVNDTCSGVPVLNDVGIVDDTIISASAAAEDVDVPVDIDQREDASEYGNPEIADVNEMDTSNSVGDNSSLPPDGICDLEQEECSVDEEDACSDMASLIETDPTAKQLITTLCKLMISVSLQKNQNGVGEEAKDQAEIDGKENVPIDSGSDAQGFIEMGGSLNESSEALDDTSLTTDSSCVTEENATEGLVGDKEDMGTSHSDIPNTVDNKCPSTGDECGGADDGAKEVTDVDQEDVSTYMDSVVPDINEMGTSTTEDAAAIQNCATTEEAKLAVESDRKLEASNDHKGEDCDSNMALPRKSSKVMSIVSLFEKRCEVVSQSTSNKKLKDSEGNRKSGLTLPGATMDRITESHICESSLPAACTTPEDGEDHCTTSQNCESTSPETSTTPEAGEDNRAPSQNLESTLPDARDTEEIDDSETATDEDTQSPHVNESSEDNASQPCGEISLQESSDTQEIDDCPTVQSEDNQSTKFNELYQSWVEGRQQILMPPRPNLLRPKPNFQVSLGFGFANIVPKQQ